MPVMWTSREAFLHKAQALKDNASRRDTAFSTVESQAMINGSLKRL